MQGKITAYSNGKTLGEFFDFDRIAGYYFGDSPGLLVFKGHEKSHVSFSAVATPDCDKIILTNKVLDRLVTADVVGYKKVCYFNGAEGETNYKISLGYNNSVQTIKSDRNDQLRGVIDEKIVVSSSMLNIIEPNKEDPYVEIQTRNFNSYSINFLRKSLIGSEFVPIEGTFFPLDSDPLQLIFTIATSAIVIGAIFIMWVLCCAGFCCFHCCKCGCKKCFCKKHHKDYSHIRENLSDSGNGTYMNVDDRDAQPPVSMIPLAV